MKAGSRTECIMIGNKDADHSAEVIHSMVVLTFANGDAFCKVYQY